MSLSKQTKLLFHTVHVLANKTIAQLLCSVNFMLVLGTLKNSQDTQVSDI